MSLLIKNVDLNGKIRNIFVEGKKISDLNYKGDADKVIDGSNKLIISSFVNGHTHAAMSLFRGYGDDMPLMDWLSKKIWPAENKLNEDLVYKGSKFGCLEMIKTGTTCFNDMYHFPIGTAKAASEMGLRCFSCEVFFDVPNFENVKKRIIDNVNKMKEMNLVNPVLGPHSIYTVSEENLMWAKEYADKNDLKIHIHLSETKKEVDDCLEKNKKRPVEYLEDIGFLGNNVIAAHCIWVNDKEIDILKKNNVKVIHNPISNMKLGSGIFPFDNFIRKGVSVGLGTDGSASNNNLSMFDEMKVCGLLHKVNGNVTSASSNKVFEMATSGNILGLNLGSIKEGFLADFLLLDKKNIFLNPNLNLISNLVYSADSSCVSDVVCDGNVLMENFRIGFDEEEIINKINESVKNLV